MHLAGSSPHWPMAGHEAYGHSHLNNANSYNNYRITCWLTSSSSCAPFVAAYTIMYASYQCSCLSTQNGLLVYSFACHCVTPSHIAPQYVHIQPILSAMWGSYIITLYHVIRRVYDLWLPPSSPCCSVEASSSPSRP